MGKQGCLRDSVSGSRCFPGEQFGENRDKQLTTVRDNQLWFRCFLSFCFFEMFFLLKQSGEQVTTVFDN